MSDNTQLNPGTGGDVIATDDIGGVKFQRVKVNFGVDGAATDVSAVNPLPVAILVSPASNLWAQAPAITSGATASLASVLVNSTGYQVKGFIAHGTGDGYFYVQINSLTVLSGRTRVSLPTLVITLPNGIGVATGQTVSLKVTNESGSTADYEATLLGA